MSDWTVVDSVYYHELEYVSRSLKSSLAYVDVCETGEQDHLQSLGLSIASKLSIGFRLQEQSWLS